MPGKVNVNGGQGTTIGILAKVNGAWHGASSAFIKVGGQWKQWFRASVIDSFNRTTDVNLGTADSAQTWSATRGTWFANGSKAQSTDSTSNYPIAAIDTGSVNNIQTVGTVSNGAGAAQWVTDSGNWFGVATGQEVVNTVYYYSCGCSTCASCVAGYSTSSPGCCSCSGGGTYYYVCSYTYCYSGNTYSYTSPGYSYATYGGGSYLYYVYVAGSTYTLYSPGYCNTNYAVCSSYTPCTYSCGCTNYSYVCTQSVTYSCGCSSCQGGSVSYPAFVYIYQSIANSVSQVLRTSISSVASSLKVVTSGGNTMTVTPYSDSLTTPIGSPITYTASSTQTATQFGILLSPSQYNQGNTLDNYSSQNN